MNKKPVSRREFVMLTGATPFAVSALLQSRAPTAQQVVDRIKQKAGIDWKADGVDTFKAGDPATPVKGIAASAMATLDVLKQAVKAGANFVITCEPTFYSRSDAVAAKRPVRVQDLPRLGPSPGAREARRRLPEGEGLQAHFSTLVQGPVLLARGPGAQRTIEYEPQEASNKKSRAVADRSSRDAL